MRGHITARGTDPLSEQGVELDMLLEHPVAPGEEERAPRGTLLHCLVSITAPSHADHAVVSVRSVAAFDGRWQTVGERPEHEVELLHDPAAGHSTFCGVPQLDSLEEKVRRESGVPRTAETRASLLDYLRRVDEAERAVRAARAVGTLLDIATRAQVISALERLIAEDVMLT